MVVVWWPGEVGWWGVWRSQSCLAWVPVTTLGPATPSAGRPVDVRILWLYHLAIVRVFRFGVDVVLAAALYFGSGSMPSAPRKQQPNMMMGPPQMTTDPTSPDGDGEPEETSVVEAKLDRRLFRNSYMCLGAPKYVLTAPTQST